MGLVSIAEKPELKVAYSLPITEAEAFAFESAIRRNGRDVVLANEVTALGESGITLEETDYQTLRLLWSPRTKDSRLSDLWYPRVEKHLEKDTGIIVICPQGTHKNGQISCVIIEGKYALTLGILPQRGDLSSHTKTRRGYRILSQDWAGLDWWELNARWKTKPPRGNYGGWAIGDLVFVYRHLDTIQGRVPVDKVRRDLYHTQLPLGGKRDFASDTYPVQRA